ncbi:hypothetical protein FGG08_004390 [Glutinoglossum americanum]|uniref:Uncharacterized protein n=1 Tax=Glutinoglossum americanum TaxID=1670608 RepID=A0A9P8I2F8_9PEZI|nr:hypothetical protein FGG08_004390 [Glutinoglossum americanum]
MAEHLRRMHNSEEHDGKLVLLPPSGNHPSSNPEHPDTQAMTPMTAGGQHIPLTPPASFSPLQVVNGVTRTVTSVSPPVSSAQLHRQPIIVEMRPSSATKRTHEESTEYQGESLQSKLRRKEAECRKIDAEKQKLDQEIRVLRQALAIV